MVCSLRWCAEEALEAQVVGLFEDARLRPDTRADLARVCLAAGFRSALPVLQRLGPHEGVGAEGVEQAIAGLLAMEQEGWLDGGWISEGLDCGEVNPSPSQGPAGLYIGPEGAISIEAATSAQCLPGAPRGLRRMSVRRAGNPLAQPMLQFAGRCWRRAEETEQAELIDQMLPVAKVDWRHPLSPSAERVLLVRLASRGQPEGGVGLRNRALLAAASGRLPEAQALLEEAIEARRTPADAWLFLGELKAGAGELAGARDCWEQCLRRSRRKKDWAALTAKERLGG
jgi:tetratricopeptide (TPR) repeat protein